MLSVLPKYMDSLFSYNHPLIAFSSMLCVFCMSVGFLPLTSRIESSAVYRKISQLILVIISLTYILKSIGPNMEPCGTPHVMFRAVDALPFTLTTCFLPVRYDLTTTLRNRQPLWRLVFLERIV